MPIKIITPNENWQLTVKSVLSIAICRAIVHSTHAQMIASLTLFQSNLNGLRTITQTSTTSGIAKLTQKMQWLTLTPRTSSKSSTKMLSSTIKNVRLPYDLWNNASLYAGRDLGRRNKPTIQITMPTNDTMMNTTTPGLYNPWNCITVAINICCMLNNIQYTKKSNLKYFSNFPLSTYSKFLDVFPFFLRRWCANSAAR